MKTKRNRGYVFKRRSRKDNTAHNKCGNSKYKFSAAARRHLLLRRSIAAVVRADLNVFIKILKSDVLSDGHAVVTEADLRETYGGGSSTGPTSGAGGAANLAEDHPPDLRMLRVTLMRQLLINASLQACLNRQRHSVAVIDQADGRRSRDGDGPLRMDLGLHCQETEFLRARVVKGLRGLVRALETDASERVVSDALQALWDAIWSDEDVDLIATQLLYADSVYAALPQALSEAGSLLTRQGLDPAALETSLRPAAPGSTEIATGARMTRMPTLKD